jgi:hypothetical protein
MSLSFILASGEAASIFVAFLQYPTERMCGVRKILQNPDPQTQRSLRMSACYAGFVRPTLFFEEAALIRGDRFSVGRYLHHLAFYPGCARSK